MKLFYIIVITAIICPSQILHCQASSSTIAINKPSIVSTHPFGIFFTRTQGYFRNKPNKRLTFNIALESGNVWSPPVTGFIPTENNIKTFVSGFEWHEREFMIDVNAIESKTIEVQNDGVIKGFRPQIFIPLNAKSELQIGLRMFTLSKGNFPFSIITNDEFIEFFHDNIAGGSDPFDRKLYPFNEGYIRYKDRDNRIMEIESGDFMFSGIELNYYYFPEIRFKGIDTNIGVHLGVNNSKFNASLDIAISMNLLKSIPLKNENTINLGTSFGANRLKAFSFSDSNIDFNSNNYLGFAETIIEYNLINKSSKTTHSFGIDFYLQTSLNKKSEFDYLIPTKNGTSLKSWASGINHLYRNNNYWTFIYTYSRKIKTSVYIQQDLTVNNNPDIQTGIQLSFNL